MHQEEMKINEKMQKEELARAYVPFQQAGQLYDMEQSLVRGTVFPELDKPYIELKHNK